MVWQAMHSRGSGLSKCKVLWPNRIVHAAAAVLCLILSGCNQSLETRLESPAQINLDPKGPTKLSAKRESSAPAGTPGGNYQIFPGEGQQLAEGETSAPPGVSEAAPGKYSINIDNASVADAAKLILGETLGRNYVLDPRVQGTITLSTSRPASSSAMLDAFEAALRLNGAALVESDGVTKIVALQEVLDGELGNADFGNDGTTQGWGVSAIPLRHVKASAMMTLLDSFIARSGSVRASNAGNMILLRGTAAERQNLADVVLSFDVDQMKGQTASMAILSNARPDDMASKLATIFAEDTALSGPNAIKVIPLERLNGVIVIANSSAKVKRALNWVRRLDRESTTDTNYYVYQVQNGNAADFAKILTATFTEGGAGPGLTAEVAPDKPTTEITSGPETPPGTPGEIQPPEMADQGQQSAALPQETARAAEPQGDVSSKVRFTPNLANNTIVIRASPREYRKILATLKQMDAPGVQVQINTIIAEVALNDNLRYGVQAYLRSSDVSGGMFNGNALTLRPSFPGFNFFIGGAADPRLVIDALSAVTKVRIISSPSIVVLENEKATIKVGDQVPIKVQTLQRDSGGSVDSFEYRDTGVILTVKPRVNSNGLVTIELGQELSSVVAGSGSSTTEAENPTFSQRYITSKVSVQNSQTVLLGGLISGQSSKQRNSVPIINQVPVIGDLVGSTDKKARRNELIVFITPNIIQNAHDASRLSKELRDKMRGLDWE
jgi:general secretion pathway protein D